jgi:hypothetical protein
VTTTRVVSYDPLTTTRVVSYDQVTTTRVVSYNPVTTTRAISYNLVTTLTDDSKPLTAFTPQPLSTDCIAAASRAGYNIDSPQVRSGGEPSLNDLFDLGEFLVKKREKQLAKKQNRGDISMTVMPTRKKIKRSDVEAYT